MSTLPLLEPADCALILVDEQAGLAFAAGSQDPQILRNNGLAVAKTAIAFDVPVVVSTSASKVYSGPLMPAFRDVLPDVTPIERRNMNLWEDDAARAAIAATGKRTLIIAGLLTLFVSAGLILWLNPSVAPGAFALGTSGEPLLDGLRATFGTGWAKLLALVAGGPRSTVGLATGITPLVYLFNQFELIAHLLAEGDEAMVV